jgi:hypothetical protein
MLQHRMQGWLRLVNGTGNQVLVQRLAVVCGIQQCFAPVSAWLTASAAAAIVQMCSDFKFVKCIAAA